MTRTATSHSLKHPSDATKGDGKPKEGTSIRRSYDAARRGEIIYPGIRTTLIRTLTDIYGMELERLGPKNSHKGYRLIGEWVGSRFVTLEEILIMVKAKATNG